VPRSLQDALDHADELSAVFEDAESGEFHDAAPLRVLRAAVIARADAERAVDTAVLDARGAGLSWAAIAAMLGTSGEAARQRYSSRVASATTVAPATLASSTAKKQRNRS